MHELNIIVVIIAMGAMTWSLRAVPFLLIEIFQQYPIIQYLGRALPGSVMLILVIYSLKNVVILHYPYGLPSLAAVANVMLIHLWRRNVFMSIVIGTAVYASLSYMIAVVH